MSRRLTTSAIERELADVYRRLRDPELVYSEAKKLEIAVKTLRAAGELARHREELAADRRLEAHAKKLEELFARGPGADDDDLEFNVPEVEDQDAPRWRGDA